MQSCLLLSDMCATLDPDVLFPEALVKDCTDNGFNRAVDKVLRSK